MVLGKNTKLFLEAIVASVGPTILSLSQGEAKDKLGASLMQSLLGDSPERALEPIATSRDQRLTVNIFQNFIEINSCLERLKDFETYIAKFPYKNTRVSRHAYLQFVVEAHLNEIYILRERLVAFTKLIARSYRKDIKADKYAAYAAAIEEYAVTSLNGFTRARGAHVHTHRYSNDDIDRLSLIATLEKSPDKSFNSAIKALKRMAIVESHERLTKQTRKWNRAASKVVEECCKVALPLIFDESRKSVRYPKLSITSN